MTIDQIVLKKIDEGNSNRFLLLDTNGTMFVITELLYDILIYCKQTSDYYLVSTEVNKKHDVVFVDPEFITKALSSTFSKLAAKSQSKTATEFIYLKIRLIKEGQLTGAYGILSFLFNKYLCVFFSLSSFLFTIYFIFENRFFAHNSVYRNIISNFSPFNFAAIYSLMLIVIILHEIGHASASFFFKLPPKEIGFGFYLVFPVFYSDVTDIWQLSKFKRIVVNFAGIYFQLIINLIFIAVWLSGVHPQLFIALIVANTLSMIGSLNPFFRYDGYWVYSDFFDLPNLKYQFRKVAFRILYEGPKRYFNFIKSQSASLLVYTLLNSFFWVFVYFKILRYFIVKIALLLSLFNLQTWTINLSQLYHPLLTCISLGFVTYLLILQLKQNFKMINNERKGILQRTS
jgi:putative peptide zinc metalloprotease protein